MRFKINIKSVISISCIIIVLALTVIISLFNVGLDPNKLNFNKWVGDIGILVGLSMIGMFGGETFFSGYLTQNTKGLYQQSLQKYNLTRDEIDKYTCYFGQYIEEKYLEDIKNAKLNYLLAHNIDKAQDIIKLDIKDINKLENPCCFEIEKKKIYFKSYSLKQIKIIKYALEGNLKIKKTSKDFYLSALSHGESLSDYQIAANISHERRTVLTISRIIKIISMILISAFWAMITVDDFVGEGATQAVVNLLSRIIAIFTGFWAGCFNSSLANKVDVKGLNIKRRMLSEFQFFLEKNPNYYERTDEEEKAYQEYKEFEKKEEERKKNIITPELVEEKEVNYLVDYGKVSKQIEHRKQN